MRILINIALSGFPVPTAVLCNFGNEADVVLALLPVVDGKLVVDLVSNSETIGGFQFTVVDGEGKNETITSLCSMPYIYIYIFTER